MVGDLGRRHVEDGGEQARVDELLHRLPAGARGVEHERFEARSRASGEARDQRRGDAEHREPHEWPVGGLAPECGWLTMPASAWAALPSTCREMRFRPATSVTEYIIAMSDGPT